MDPSPRVDPDIVCVLVSFTLFVLRFFTSHTSVSFIPTGQCLNGIVADQIHYLMATQFTKFASSVMMSQSSEKN